MSAQRRSPDERPKGCHAFARRSAVAARRPADAWRRAARGRAPGAARFALAGAAPSAPTGAARSAPTGAARSAPTGAALRALLWSRFGTEGGRPGGLRAPMRVRLAQPPRISPGKRGRSGAVREPPRFVAGNWEESGVVRPIAPQGVAKDARSAAQRTRKRTASLLALLPHCPIATSAPRGERRRRGRHPARGGADAEQPVGADAEQPGGADAEQARRRGPRAAAAPGESDAGRARRAARVSLSRAPRQRRPGHFGAQRPARKASASRNCCPFGVPMPVTSS